MFVGKVKLFVFGLVIGSAFLMSSCTLPTLGDTGVSSSHQEARPKNETSSSSGEQAYTGVLSLSGAVKILEAKERERSKQYEQELLNNSGANYNYDYTDAITQQELQGLSNWLTQEENAIKPYKFFDDMLGNPTKLFEIAIDDEKYYWINGNGNQLGYVQENEHNPYPSIDTDTGIPDQSETSFVFLIRERGEKKDIVYIHCVPGFNFGSIPWIIFDEKNQVFEMRENSGLQFEIDRSFKNKRKVNEYVAPSPFNFDSDEALKNAPLHIQYLGGQDIKYKESAILYFIIENSPAENISALAETFSAEAYDSTKIIKSLEKNRAIPTLSHMSKEGDMVIFELEWLTFTRLKNMGLPQGKHNYAISKARFCKSFGGPVCESIAIEKLKKVKGAYGDESYSGKYLTGLLLWDYDTINFEKDIVYTLTGDEFQYNNHIQWYSKEKEFNKLEFLSLFEKFRNNDYLGIKSDFEKNKELIPFYPTCCAGKTYFYFEPYRNGIFVLQKGGNGGISYGLSYITYKNGKIYEISKDTGFFIEEDNLYIDSVKTGVAPKDYDKKIIGYFTGVEKNEKLNNLFSLFKIEIDNLYK